jgi:hypothetical protein
MAILGPKSYRFGLRDPVLIFIRNLNEFSDFTMIPMWESFRLGPNSEQENLFRDIKMITALVRFALSCCKI